MVPYIIYTVKGSYAVNNEKYNSIISDALNDSHLEANEIPAIDLYLEQIIKLIKEKNEQGSERYYHRFPTKTMVNNYSKAGLITPLKGKTYNKEQIIQILLTNSLKNTLSMAEIRKIMKAFEQSENDACIPKAYTKYIELKDSNKNICPDVIEDIIAENSFDTSSNMDCLMLCMALADIADYFKCISKALLEATADELGICDDEENDPSEKDLKKAQKKVDKAQKKAEREYASDSDNDIDKDAVLDAESDIRQAEDVNP